MVARLIIAFACAALAGCAVGSTPITTPNGTKGFAIHCNSQGAIGHAVIGWGNCYEQASKSCPRGYTILERTGEDGAVGGAAASGSEYSANISTVKDRSMIIECKDT